jgi:AraC-like DNA-binding protein/quercetin dioxygenase-like cupin family protein
MPFYHPEENEIGSAGRATFSLEDVPRAVVAGGAAMVTKGIELAVHSHRKAQLLLTLRGIITCEVDKGVWIVPPRCAVWIPGNLPHSMTAAGEVEMYWLFVEPDEAPALPRQCCTLSISPLLEHLLLHVTQMPVLYDVDGADGRIATVLLDQLSLAPVDKLNFPMPADTKLRKIAAALMADPSDRATMDEWSQRTSIAPRTLARILQRETGMSFGRWRQQLHILFALRRLTQGASVQTVAVELGYEGASAFVTMFRKAMGKPPARYLAERQVNS